MTVSQRQWKHYDPMMRLKLSHHCDYNNVFRLQTSIKTSYNVTLKNIVWIISLGTFLFGGQETSVAEPAAVVNITKGFVRNTPNKSHTKNFPVKLITSQGGGGLCLPFDP